MLKLLGVFMFVRNKKEMLIVYFRVFFGLRKIIFFLGLICEVVWNKGYNDFCNKGDNYCK